MKGLKPIDYKLLFELMKDSHRSDRQLARAIGVSQPTVTRRRALLEKNYIEGYTVIPKLGQIGFEMAAFNFIKSKAKLTTNKDKEEAQKKLKEWYLKQPNVIMVSEGTGMGWDAMVISLHENFSSYSEFIRTQNAELADWVVESQTFNVDLKTGIVLKSFHLKYLASLKAGKN
ncbi:MAG: Lrp/AsnC family transcriptional regulator [Candidatus Bathyarchaeota archaeon]|nr:Lrp/AsnC family transcriptional regulator [Candidatus Bathyarchaeota archaeon]